jgi:tetratricopeptide (TPR) repeat protein
MRIDGRWIEGTLAVRTRWRWAVSIAFCSVLAISASIEAQDSSAELRRALILRDDGKLVESRVLLEKLADSQDSGVAVEAERVLGYVLFDLGQVAEARAAFVRALGRGRASGDVFLRIAQIDAESGNVPLALEGIRLAGVAGESSAEIALLHAELARQLGQVGEAEAIYRRLILAEPTRAELEVRLGVLLQELGRPREAILHFMIAYELGDASSELTTNVAEILAQRGDPSAAAAWLERSLPVDSAAAGRRALRRAQLLHLIGDLTAAREVAEALIPSSAAATQGAARIVLGQIAVESDDPETAALHLAAAVELGEEHSNILAYLAAWNERNGNHSGAAGYYARCVDGGQNDAATVDRLIHCLVKIGDRPAAIERLRTWIEFHGIDANARDWLRLLARSE